MAKRLQQTRRQGSRRLLSIVAIDEASELISGHFDLRGAIARSTTLG
ncbi:hypothetical protein [Paenibacillus periandrae]|nr:hypothetical protein [Paenibacillus periandrae]